MALRPDRDKGTFPTCGLEMLVRIATLDLAPTKGETAVLVWDNHAVSAALLAGRRIGKGKLECHAFLRSRDSGDVALARCVFDQFDVAWSDRDLFPTGYFKLAVTAQRNDVLAARRGVPIADSTGRGAMQLSSGCHHHFEDIVAVSRNKFGLYLFGMGLAVGPGVKPGYEHTFVFLRTVGLRARKRNEA